MPAATIASRLRAATRRERTHRQKDSLHARFARDGVETETVARVASLVEQLSPLAARSTEIDVDAAVFRDAIVVVVRTHVRAEALDDRQIALLREHTITWSSIGGKDGRTICFEIARC